MVQFSSRYSFSSLHSFARRRAGTRLQAEASLQTPNLTTSTRPVSDPSRASGDAPRKAACFSHRNTILILSVGENVNEVVTNQSCQSAAFVTKYGFENVIFFITLRQFQGAKCSVTKNISTHFLRSTHESVVQWPENIKTHYLCSFEESTT